MRVPLKVQVGAVVVLFVAAVVSLWTTSAAVVAREGRRVSSRDLLDRAGEALAGRAVARALLAGAPRFPYRMDRGEWDELDRRLADEAAAALEPFEGVEGGYFLRDHKFLGAVPPAAPRPPEPKKKARPDPKKKAPPEPKRAGPRRQPGPPPREADLIEIQVDAAIRKDQVLFVVEDVPPSTVAIRTAPVRVDGRVVAATWTMIRLVDPLFLDRSVRGYRLSAGLALGGIALALLLTAGLSRTVRSQAIERDRLQAELRRSERLAALGKLLAGVAHEVRNPLAGIRSTVQLWQRGIGPDDETFAGLVSEVDRLEDIVARLLHFSKADAQDAPPSDLDAAVAEVARLAGGPAEAQGVRVELELAPGRPRVRMAPPTMVQVLRNLTTNALQAMPDGGTLRIATRLASSRGAVEVVVADTGPGLSPEVAAHLFEPFFTTKPSGTGLGLAIAREIALAHRGELRAGPRAGGPGAEFTLTLPLADEDDAKTRGPDDAELA
jgi:two-component system, NtrC family, sensor histidine kinase HydH